MIIVTFAVQAEFAAWRRLRNFKRVADGVFVTQNGATEVQALITGIRARKFQLPPAGICIAAGVAGSLKQQHGIGKILVANAIKREGMKTVLTCDGPLVRAATQCGATPVDVFYTADTIVSSSSEKLRLGQIADAVDMESYPVMADAQRHGVPAVAIRAISDTVDQNLPLDFSRAISEDGRIEWLPALSQVAVSPGRLPQLVRFGLASTKAARKLAQFLERYLKCLTEEGDLLLAARGVESR
jgi:hypothetical protein